MISARKPLVTLRFATLRGQDKTIENCRICKPYLHDNATGVGSTDGDIKEASWIGHLDKDVVDLKGFKVWFHKTSAAFDGKESSESKQAGAGKEAASVGCM